MHESSHPTPAATLPQGGPDRTSELGLALARILRHPLAGLRASMESVAAAARVKEDAAVAESLEDILAQIGRLANDVESLAEFATPRPLRPLRCTLDELLHAATRSLNVDQLDRLKIARPAQPLGLVVDGPLFASSLHHLIESALDTEADWLLLQVRRDGDCTYFALVEGSTDSSFAPSDATGSPEEAHLDLGLRLAHRDICRMGGAIDVETTDRGYTRIVVSMPNGADRRRSSER